MPRILDDDPTQAVCPNFEGPEWEFLRRAIIKTRSGIIPLSTKANVRQLREAWARDNDARVAAWNSQLEPDLGERDRQAREVTEDRRSQPEKEAEEQRSGVEKKKPRINSFDPTRRVGDWIVPRPALYAMTKLDNLEYVELDYFTGLRPSKNIRNDEDLSWEEMSEAKNWMLRFIAQSGLWPKAHAESLAAFFIALERHPCRHTTNGKTALLLYQSRVRREWFEALGRNEGFNIGLIQDNLVRAIIDEVNQEVNDKIREIKIDQIRKWTQATFETDSTRPKRHREWDDEPLNRNRSPSPRAEPSRKRLRSRRYDTRLRSGSGGV